MLFALLPLADQFQAFNLFRYITFRTGGATITSLIISLLFGPAFIRCQKHIRPDKPIRGMVQNSTIAKLARQQWAAY